MPLHRPALFALAASTILVCASARAGLPTHRLENGTVRATVTEAIGGRLLSFSLLGKPNFLLVNETAGDPNASVDANSENVGFLGHETWAGPQSQWWTHQAVNPGRAQAKAPWPPDPYQVLAKYTLKRRSGSEVIMDSPASPVNGLQLRKRYALVEGKPSSLKLEVEATNTREQAIAWDIWFNTRVRPDTQVYVPVAAEQDVRMQPTAGMAPPRYSLDEKLLSLDVTPELARRGKLFIQPSAGWMAAFHGDQAFVIQFKLQPRSAIHPEQGQVELYHDLEPGEPAKGVLEMEVHAPYRKLAPGRSMRSSELWTILPYEGQATREAHAAFLRKHASELGLDGL